MLYILEEIAADPNKLKALKALLTWSKVNIPVVIPKILKGSSRRNLRRKLLSPYGSGEWWVHYSTTVIMLLLQRDFFLTYGVLLTIQRVWGVACGTLCGPPHCLVRLLISDGYQLPHLWSQTQVASRDRRCDRIWWRRPLGVLDTFQNSSSPVCTSST